MSKTLRFNFKFLFNAWLILFVYGFIWDIQFDNNLNFEFIWRKRLIYLLNNFIIYERKMYVCWKEMYAFWYTSCTYLLDYSMKGRPAWRKIVQPRIEKLASCLALADRWRRLDQVLERNYDLSIKCQAEN